MGFIVFLFVFFFLVRFVKKIQSQNAQGQQPPVDDIPVNEDEENAVVEEKKPEVKERPVIVPKKPIVTPKRPTEVPKKPVEKTSVVETPKPVAPVKPVETKDLKQEVDDFSRMQRERNEEFERMLKEKNDQFFRSRKN